MKPKDVFKLAVRLLGLVFLYQGVSTLVGVIPLVIACVFAPIVINAVISGSLLAVAWWLIGGAPQLCDHAYPGSDEDEN